MNAQAASTQGFTPWGGVKGQIIAGSSKFEGLRGKHHSLPYIMSLSTGEGYGIVKSEKRAGQLKRENDKLLADIKAKKKEDRTERRKQKLAASLQKQPHGLTGALA